MCIKVSPPAKWMLTFPWREAWELEMNRTAEVAMLIQMPRYFACSGKINARVT